MIGELQLSWPNYIFDNMDNERPYPGVSLRSVIAFYVDVEEDDMMYGKLLTKFRITFIPTASYNFVLKKGIKYYARWIFKRK